MNEKVRATQKQLLTDGMVHLDDALANFMELDSVEGHVLTELTHAVLLYAEKLIEINRGKEAGEF